MINKYNKTFYHDLFSIHDINNNKVFNLHVIFLKFSEWT